MPWSCEGYELRRLSSMDIENIEQNLRQFTGTTQYYRGFLGTLMTDGVKYLCDQCSCYWLVDLIGSYQGQLNNVGFQIWKVEVYGDQTARVTCKEDSDSEVLVEQWIDYTDFPLAEYELWKIDDVILLKNEY